jgi:Putative MetA-pathway of phenol degradation
MRHKLAATATIGALLISSGFSPALAGSVAQPGETVGIAAGAPLSPGLYFTNTADWGCRNTTPASCLGITIPAPSYTGNDWNLTANVIYGIQLDQVTNRPQISPCPAPFGFNGCNPDFINIDLTAVKKFGKWQLGPGAYGSSDLTRPIAGYQQQTQFAAGALFGYDFGLLTLQAYATTDVVEHNYGGRDTRGWFRMIVPLWTPPTFAQITK